MNPFDIAYQIETHLCIHEINIDKQTYIRWIIDKCKDWVNLQGLDIWKLLVSTICKTYLIFGMKIKDLF